MNPWLITIRPLIVPSDARQELLELAHNKTPEQYSNAIWRLRASEHPAKAKSRGVWPIQRAQTNVLPIRKRKALP
jgi:hypothetical protein